MSEAFENTPKQKAPSKETRQKLDEKIKWDFYDIAVQMSHHRGEFSPKKWPNYFLFETSKNYTKKSVEISMTTIGKKNRTKSEELTIIQDKTWFTVIHKQNINTYGTPTIKEIKIANTQFLLPYLQKIQLKFKDYRNIKNQKVMMIAENDDRKQADYLIDSFTA